MKWNEIELNWFEFGYHLYYIIYIYTGCSIIDERTLRYLNNLIKMNGSLLYQIFDLRLTFQDIKIYILT